MIKYKSKQTLFAHIDLNIETEKSGQTMLAQS